MYVVSMNTLQEYFDLLLSLVYFNEHFCMNNRKCLFVPLSDFWYELVHHYS